MLLNCGVGEDSWESLGLQGDPTSPFWRTSVLGVNWKDWCWNWNSNTLATWCKKLTHRGQEEKGMTEDEMVGWHPWLNGHGVGQTSAVGDIQAGLACCSSWGRKELETIEWLNWTESNSGKMVLWGMSSPSSQLSAFLSKFLTPETHHLIYQPVYRKQNELGFGNKGKGIIRKKALNVSCWSRKESAEDSSHACCFDQKWGWYQLS